MPYKNAEDRKRNQKKWREANKDRIKKLGEEFRRRNGVLPLAEYRKKVTKNLSEWSCRYSDPKVRAHKLFFRAIRKGRIKKPSTCSICLKAFPAREIHGHHADYSKWQQVSWVCRKCHFTIEHKDWGKAGAKVAGGKKAQRKRMNSLIKNGTLGNNQFNTK
jgi:hypothetical protein